MEISKITLKHCLGLGFIAANYSGLQEMALGIFRMARALTPESSSWVIGMGMAYAHGKEGPAMACQYMTQEGDIDVDKGDMVVRAFFGLFSIMAKQLNRGEKILQSVIDDGSDEVAVQLARAAMENELKQ